MTAQAQIHKLQAEVDRIKRARKAQNTVESYRFDWKAFTEWCEEVGKPSLPASPETIMLYVAAQLIRGRKITTVQRHLSSIAHYHLAGGFENPSKGEPYRLLDLAQRDRRERPRQMRPLTVGMLRQISALLREDATWLSLRNRAMLVLAFATALRRSNVTTLALNEIEFCDEGVIVNVGREKQDQAGRGRLIGVPNGKHPDTCASLCLRDWLHLRGDRPGPLFPRYKRGEWHAVEGERLWVILKREVARIGLDPKDRWGAHSLRAGLITAAGDSGAGELVIAHHTGHRTMPVLRRYFRRQELWRNNVAGMVGL